MSGNRCYCLCAAVLALFLSLPLPLAAASGDAGRGKNLFVGSTVFELGGAPCLACHNLTGFGLSDGANFGPDLSTLYDNYGPEGIEGVLQSLAFPSMEAIYSSRPLNETERADLLAFLQQTSQLSATPTTGKLALQVCIGVLILLGLTFLIGKRRMRATRQPLIDRQRNLINKGGLQ